MSVSSYNRRPQGYDLFSLSMQDKLSKTTQEKELKEALEKAESAVSAYEAYEITDVQTATGMKDVHSAAVTAVEQIPMNINERILQSGL